MFSFFRLIPVRAFCVVTVLLLSGFLGSSVYAASSISGTVYDKQRNPLVDVDVELLNDYYQQIRRARTDGSGRYTFDGLNDGRYWVKVMAFRYDVEDQTQPVEIVTVDIRGNQGTSFQILDFQMMPRKGGLAESELGVVYAQEVPKEARKLYEKAMKDFQAKRQTDGIISLNEAVKIFPDYYAALQRLGKELINLKKYEDAAPFLFKAAQVNTRSAESLYLLGYSLFNMGKDYYPASLASLKQAVTMVPEAVNVVYFLGKVERAARDFAGAEKHLLKAKEMTKVPVAEIHLELVQLYANDLKQFGKAADELEEFIKNTKPNDQTKQEMRKRIVELREKAKTQASK